MAVLEVVVPVVTVVDLATVPEVVEAAEVAPLVSARAVVAVPARSPSAHDDPLDSELFASLLPSQMPRPNLDSVLPTATT